MFSNYFNLILSHIKFFKTFFLTEAQNSLKTKRYLRIDLFLKIIMNRKLEKNNVNI
jgi:hypothetical protein